MRYAANTDVPADRSRGEIERTLRRYGADQFFYGWETGRAILAFGMSSRQVRVVLPMPNRNDAEFRESPTGRSRAPAAAEKAWEQATRQRWRALALVIKAKLEAVESGITTFEEEFLAHLILPNSQTVGEYALPRIDEAIKRGGMPKLLPGPSDKPLKLVGDGGTA